MPTLPTFVSAPLRLALLGLLAAQSSQADQGKIPLYQPGVISQPGSYVLTRNFLSPGMALQVNASNVTIDLAGHEIVAGAGSSGIMLSPGFTDLVVRNGRISGGADGVYFYSLGARGTVQVEDVRFSGFSQSGVFVYGAEDVTVRRCAFVASSGPGNYAVLAHGISGAFHGRFVDNEIHAGGGGGMSLTGLSSGEIRGNLIDGVGTAGGPVQIGIDLNATAAWSAGHNVVRDNAMRSPASAGFGIYMNNSLDDLVDGNTVWGFGYGIYAATRCRISGNVCNGSAMTGITVFDQSRVEDNHCENGGGDGIVAIGVNNFLEDNSCSGNGGRGLNAGGASNRYKGNYLLGNSLGAVIGGGDAGGNVTS